MSYFLKKTDLHVPTIRKIYHLDKMIGRGSNSIVFANKKNNTKVFMATLDKTKTALLEEVFGIAKDITDKYKEITGHYPCTRNGKDIFFLETKKFNRLSNRNKKRLRKLIELFDRIRIKEYDRLNRKGHFYDVIWHYESVKILRSILYRKQLVTQKESEYLEKLEYFISNYFESRKTILDIHNHNFLEDDDGNIIPIDVVFDSEIWKGN